MLKKLIFNKRNIFSWIVLVILSWISSLITVFIPYLHQIIINQLTYKENKYIFLLVLLILVYVIEIIEGYYYDYRKSCFQEKIKKEIRVLIDEHVLNLKHNFFVDNGTEKVVSRYSRDTVIVTSFYGEMMIELLGNIVMMLGALFLIVKVDFLILAVSVFVIVLYSIITVYIGKKIKIVGKQFLSFDEAALGILTENCSKDILIKLYGLYGKCSRKFINVYDKAYKGRIQMALLSATNTSGARMILYILQGGVFVVAGAGIMSNRLTIGELISMIECQSFLLIPFFFFGQFNSRYQEYINSKERIEELLMEEQEDFISSEHLKKISRIEIRDLNYSYQNSKEILKNINFLFQKGTITGIDGRSGVGKSTLISLLLGIYMPPKGCIFYDSYDICKLSLKDVREHIGYVPQESLFFNESVKENLFCKNTTDEYIEKVGIAFGIYNDIKNMDNGFETSVGVDGKVLSGGQKKRVDFLRAFCREKDVMIFDEPTAMLDQKNRDMFYKYIHKIKNNKIIIIVSHNRNELSYFDKVYTISGECS